MVAIGLAGAFVVALLVEAVERRTGDSVWLPAEAVAIAEPCCGHDEAHLTDHHGLASRCAKTLHHAADDFLDISRYLVAGVG